MAAVLCLLGALWLLPAMATLTHARALPAMSASEASWDGHDRRQRRWSEPRTGYPARSRAQMPAGRSCGSRRAHRSPLLAAAAALLVRTADVSTARRRLGRRGYDPRRARPRGWGRPRDLRALVVRALG